ncbi:MAG: hypothetical protein K8E66_06035, partial [Phycisphaerales bacterium]|nr:hypothetical protein [Phycisphaerales bacterium]
MATSRDRSVACLFAAWAFVGGAGLSAATAGDGAALAAAAGSASSSEQVSAERVIERISALLVRDKLVRARALIDELIAGPAAVGLSDAENRRVFQLLGDAERRIRRADPLEISLQRAELALVGDDLTSSESHAGAVLSEPSAVETQRAQAEMILSLVAA